MKKPKVSFRVIGESGPLSLIWFEGSLGDAVEAKKGKGVGFFSPNGELLAVEFDDMAEDRDVQSLEFERYRVEARVLKGKVTYSLETRDLKKKQSHNAA